MQNQNLLYADKLINDLNNEELEIEIGILGADGLSSPITSDLDFEKTIEMLKNRRSSGNDDLFEQSLNCEDFEALMGEYLDGALSDGLKRFFETHQQSCKNCMKSFEYYKMVVETAPQLEVDCELEIEATKEFEDDGAGENVVPADVTVRLRENLQKKLGISLKK